MRVFLVSSDLLRPQSPLPHREEKAKHHSNNVKTKQAPYHKSKPKTTATLPEITEMSKINEEQTDVKNK